MDDELTPRFLHTRYRFRRERGRAERPLQAVAADRTHRKVAGPGESEDWGRSDGEVTR